MVTEDVSFLLNVVHDLRITNSISLASLVVLLYDTSLTLRTSSSEIEYVWKANWSYGKVLFFLNRYPVVAISIVMIISNMNVASSLKLAVRCEISYRLDGWSMMALILPVQLIFVLRTFALWERNRKVLAFLILLMLACDSVIGVSIWMSERIGSVMLPQEPGLREVLGCYSTMSGISSYKVIIPAVAALMVFDAVVLALTILRFIRIRKDGEGNGSVIRILFRDGVIYYIVVLASNVANLLLYALLQRQHAGLVGSCVPILRTVMSICASRLMLNLRGAIDRVRSQSQATWGSEDMASKADAATMYSLEETVRHDAMELELRPGPALACGYDYRRLGLGEGQTSSSPVTTNRTLYRPRSTTVVEVVPGSDASTFSDVVRGDHGRVFEDGNPPLVSPYFVKNDVSEVQMGIAV
ncbi:hypothetical protein ACEPAG_9407 [Sanghuangporus baumii]